MMKYILCLLTVLFLSSATLVAQESAPPMAEQVDVALKSAHRLMKATGALLTKEDFGQLIKSQFAMEFEEDSPEWELIERQLAVMDVNVINEAMVAVHADIYTVEEMDAVSDFFETEIGRSYASKSLELAEKTMTVVSEGMQDQVLKLAEEMVKWMDEQEKGVKENWDALLQEAMRVASIAQDLKKKQGGDTDDFTLIDFAELEYPKGDIVRTEEKCFESPNGSILVETNNDGLVILAVNERWENQVAVLVRGVNDADINLDSEFELIRGGQLTDGSGASSIVRLRCTAEYPPPPPPR